LFSELGTIRFYVEALKAHILFQVGEVLDLRKDGAVVSLHKDSDDRAFIPGWLHR
jgi:hypothetical protein